MYCSQEYLGSDEEDTCEEVIKPVIRRCVVHTSGNEVERVMVM